MILAAALLLPAQALAQAWVDVEDTLTLGTSYNYSSSSEIVYSDGETTIPAQIRQHTMLLSAEYIPIERLAISVQIPFFYIKNADPFTPANFRQQGVYDSGDAYLVTGDIQANARYMFEVGPVALTPRLGIRVPSHRYEVNGNTGVSRGLLQGQFGLSAGVANVLLPGLFFQGDYQFSLSQRFETAFPETADYNQNFSQGSLIAGYFVLDALAINLAADFRIAHGGFDFLDFTTNRETGVATPTAVSNYYNALLAQDFTLVGGGASYMLTDTIQLNAFFRLFVGGGNTSNPNIFGFGASYAIPGLVGGLL